MVRPRYERSGLSKQPRGEEGAVRKGDGDIKVQATDAARQRPAQAPRSWRGAWKSAPPRVGDDGS
jgi:hypothetical protein